MPTVLQHERRFDHDLVVIRTEGRGWWSIRINDRSRRREPSVLIMTANRPSHESAGQRKARKGPKGVSLSTQVRLALAPRTPKLALVAEVDLPVAESGWMAPGRMVR